MSHRKILLSLAFALVWLCGAATALAQKPRIIGDVRGLSNKKDWTAAESTLAAYKQQFGETPAYLEALSWVGRARFASKQHEAAQQNAQLIRSKALEMLKTRRLDDEPSLPTALGAAIEVQGLSLNEQGRKSEAVAFLNDELRRWYATSIRTRIQKNLHIVDLKGKPAPVLQTSEHLGSKPPSALQGRTTLLFFWAHWCRDCKTQGPAIARLLREFGPRGLRVVAPTQPYGYVQGGEEAPREKEIKYIDEVRRKFYPDLANVPVPVSEENFKAWGASTTPTLAIIDRTGTVRMYHPGQKTFDELKLELLPLLAN